MLIIQTFRGFWGSLQFLLKFDCLLFNILILCKIFESVLWYVVILNDVYLGK